MDGVISVSNAVKDVYKTIGIESTVIHNIAPKMDVKNHVSNTKKDLGLSGKNEARGLKKEK